MSSPAQQREAFLPLGIVVERRPSRHPWGSPVWQPVAAYLAPAGGIAPWTVLAEGPGFTRYHAGSRTLSLHRKDTPAYREGLMQARPVLYVTLRQSEGAWPWQPHLVTASPFEAQDYGDTDDTLIEKVAMPEPVAAFVQAFVEAHHVEEPFHKRKRVRMDVEEQKFGKAAVFTPLTRQ